LSQPLTRVVLDRENQYKYHFKKWGWRRSLPTKKKETLSSQLQSRAAAGKLSSSMTYQGRPVDQKQIRRYLKEAARKATRDIVRGERTTAVLQLPFKQRM
jgi:hypothetical protein